MKKSKLYIFFLLLVISFSFITSCNVCDDNTGDISQEAPNIIFTAFLGNNQDIGIFEISKYGLNLSQIIGEGKLGASKSDVFSYTSSDENTDTLFVFDGSTLKIIVSYFPDRIINPVISKVSNEIFYNEGNGNLINVDKNGSLELVSSKYFIKSNHKLSNNEDKLQYFENDNGLYIVIIDMSNKVLNQKKIDEFFEIDELNLECDWSDDDTKILFTGKKFGENVIVEYSLSSDSFEYIQTKGLVAINPIYLKDTHILFTNMTGELWVYDKEKENFIVLNSTFTNEKFIYNDWSESNQMLISHLVSDGIEENSIYNFNLDFAENTVKITQELIISNKAVRAYWYK